MKLKSASLAVIALSTLGASSGGAATLVFDTEDLGATGGVLDGQSSGTFAIPEISGLFITVVSVGSGGGVLNATSSSFGINAAITGAADDTAEFDAGIGEVATFSFSQDVRITSVDFVDFGNAEVFDFDGLSITGADASGSVFTFQTPLVIAADTPFSLQATMGTIGIQGIDLTVVPEPSSALLSMVGILALLRRKR